MVYVTIPFVERHPNNNSMSIDDLLFNDEWRPADDRRPFGGGTATATYCVETVSAQMARFSRNPALIIQWLSEFNRANERLISVENRSSLFRTFHIPKRSGGLRRIDAPNNELMTALTSLKNIFMDCGMLYHTSAFAYIQNRSTIDAVKRHQKNESKWFAKFDLHNFFGATTPRFVRDMFAKTYPFSEVIRNPIGSEEFDKAIGLAFLNGGLPQGTPVSPIITNIMMIGFDYELTKWCRENSLVYTRYADDFIVSGRMKFDYHVVEERICEILREFGAPFELNKEKTRFGSSAGSNWNLGVMLNKDNNITIGNRAKRRFQTMLFNYAMDKQNNIQWPLEDIQTLEGLRSYYKMVEGEVIDRIIQHVSKKVNLDIVRAIKADLSA